MLGYLGVNLWDFSLPAILTIRVVASFLLALVLAPELYRLQISRVALVAVCFGLIGATTSSILLNMLFMFYFVLATRNLPFDFLVRASAYVLGFTILLSVVMVQIGALANEEDITHQAIELGGEIRTRLNFGYKNVNSLASLVSAFCLLLMVRGSFSWLRYGIALAITFALYDQTDSRALIVATVFFVFYVAVLNVFSRYGALLLSLSTITIFIPLAVSLLPTVFISELATLDFQLSGRLSFVSAYYDQIPAFRLLIGGMDPPTASLTIDNSFALLLGAAGLPFLVYLVIQLFRRVQSCIRVSDHRLHAFLITFWLYSFVESSMVRPEAIIGLIFWIVIIGRGANMDDERRVVETIR
jgi:hypothetical protein